MVMRTDNSLANHFLIAMPSMDDTNFSRSVTYLCEHNEEGAMGLVINHPIDMDFGEILRQLQLPDRLENLEHRPVFIGGPVLPERGFVLHRPRGDWESSLAVTDDVSLTTSLDILQAIAEGRGPQDWLFVLGYAGWSAGQLEAEIADNAWLSVAADERLIFELPVEHRWRAAAELLGVDFSLLSSDSGHA